MPEYNSISEYNLIAESGTPEWFAARRNGISATSVARAAASERAFNTEVDTLLHPVEIADNPYMKFGRDKEEWIIRNLDPKYRIRHNEWLVSCAVPGDEWMLATPDGVDLDFNHYIAEVKTTGKDWDGKAIPIQYRRQVQWQLNVTGADQCVFAWLLRTQREDGTMVSAWFEPKVVVIDRDEEMIAELIQVGRRLMTEINHTERWEYERGQIQS